ncbi:hypothetical protein A9Q84_19905 [Halobacteriovorax marinus]|uniref:Uncharacterized protein n=1 Tax=Halobacteriovorax marinus TaxID=97084 RepID=A0A1Y5F6P1_9BACT|nr:hypothetical protein A9Q84_19905 [Halobacteriovorax marinus]
MFDQELECCGAEFEKNHISFFGLLTLSFPVIVISFVLLVILSPLRLFKKRFQILETLFRSCMKLISEKPLMAKTKCSLAGSMFKVSPRLSGLTFKYFNFSIYLFVWILILTLLKVVF